MTNQAAQSIQAPKDQAFPSMEEVFAFLQNPLVGIGTLPSVQPKGFYITQYLVTPIGNYGIRVSDIFETEQEAVDNIEGETFVPYTTTMMVQFGITEPKRNFEKGTFEIMLAPRVTLSVEGQPEQDIDPMTIVLGLYGREFSDELTATSEFKRIKEQLKATVVTVTNEEDEKSESVN